MSGADRCRSLPVFRPTYAARCPEPASATIQRQTVQIPDTRAPDTTSKTVRSGNNVKILSCCFSDSRSLKSGKKHKTARSRSAVKVRHRYPINLLSVTSFCKAPRIKTGRSEESDIYAGTEHAARCFEIHSEKFPKTASRKIPFPRGG